MSRSLTKALQLHPTAASLWTYAAAWEFEHNLNAAAARALMQRGIRMCKDSAPSLWHEYFRMELLYALRLRERRRVLGIADGSGGWLAVAVSIGLHRMGRQLRVCALIRQHLLLQGAGRSGLEAGTGPSQAAVFRAQLRWDEQHS